MSSYDKNNNNIKNNNNNSNKYTGVSFCCLDFNKLANLFLLLSQHLLSFSCYLPVFLSCSDLSEVDVKSLEVLSPLLKALSEVLESWSLFT